MNKKNIFFLIFITFFLVIIFLKTIDFVLTKKYGLGNPILYQFSIKHGYLLKPNQKIFRRGNEVIINNKGMRTTKTWPQKSNENKIIFFGDSVTYGGSIVSNQDLFTEKVCKKLNKDFKEEFICGNYGLNGYSLESITRLIKFRDAYDEDIIIVTLIASDLKRSFHNVVSQPFWSKPVPTFFPAITEVFFLYLERFKNKTKHSFDNRLDDEKDKEYYLYLIRNFNEALKKSNKEYLVFYSPEHDEINEANHQNNFLKSLMKNNIDNFYDITEKLKNYQIGELFFDSIHLTKKGHTIYGEVMSSEISNLLKKDNNFN